MRRLILALVAALAALAVAGPASATPTQVNAVKQINIYASGFSPKATSITEGDTVIWTNRDAADHQVLADKGQFVSPILHKGQSFSFTFKAAGTYTYKDELHPKLTGTLTVKGLPPSLTLAVVNPIITAGDKVTLSGVVSSHKAGESVSIYYQPYPQPNPILRATILTSDGGNYSFIVGPQVLTNYQAAWKGAYATPTTVQVAPKLSLGRNGGWIIHASAGRSFIGRAVQFQRLNPSTGQWVTLKKLLLTSKSSIKFAYTLPRGVNRLRVTMSVNQAGAGFLGAIGPTVTYRQA